MPPRIKFVVMSSAEDERVLVQLTAALAPMPVLIHQDASRPRPRSAGLYRRGVRWVNPSLRTGWGDWGFASAILHSISDALAHTDFDYLQLLSPSCLPIRPLADLIDHVRTSPADYHADLFDLSRDRDTRMNFAWRALAPASSLRQRSLLRLRRWYFGARPTLEQTRSMSLFHRSAPAHGLSGAAAGAAVALTGLIPRGAGRPPAGPSTRLPISIDLGRLSVGSVWFGARREVCVRMLEIAGRPETERLFRPLAMVDELLLPTLLAHAGRVRGPSNHAVAPFDLQGHPARIDLPLLMKAAASGRYFARKFSPNAEDPDRLLALQWAGCDDPGLDDERLDRAARDDPGRGDTAQAQSGFGSRSLEADRNASALDPALMMSEQDEQKQRDRQTDPPAQCSGGVSRASPIAHHEEQR